MQNDPGAGGIAFVVLIVLVHVGCLVVCGLKGKWGVVTLGVLVFGLLASVPGACRLARPQSWWARHFYDTPTMDRAVYRVLKWPESD